MSAEFGGAGTRPDEGGRKRQAPQLVTHCAVFGLPYEVYVLNQMSVNHQKQPQLSLARYILKQRMLRSVRSRRLTILIQPRFHRFAMFPILQMRLESFRSHAGTRHVKLARAI